MWSRIFWTLATLAMRTFYLAIGALFWMVNNFKPKLRVSPPTSPILLQSATKLAQMIRDREVTSEAVVLAYIERIRQVNPVINSVVVENFEDAINKARSIDQTLSFDDVDGKLVETKPFLGVPFTLKDAFLVKAGIVARRDKKSKETAMVVQRMQDAGGIVLAITNVSEACMWMESSNRLYGRSNNPYDTRRIVGGSSGGEAALISSAGSVIGIGSDIGGSLRMPAFFNGIFSHKPSDGILPNDGQVPEAHGYQINMCEAGPMTRYFEDLAPMLKVMAGPNQHMLQLDKKVDISKLRFFYIEEIHTPATSCVSNNVHKTLKKVVHYLQRRHNVMCHRLDLPLVHWAVAMWLNDMGDVPPGTPTFTQEITDYQGDVNLVTEFFCRWPLNRSNHTIPALALGAIEKFDSYLIDETRQNKLRAMRQHLQRQLADLLGDNGVLLMPTHPVTAPFHGQPIFQPFNWIYTGLFNALTMPATQVPIGLCGSGVPNGLQVIGTPCNDHLCLAVGGELANAFGGWTKPW